MRSVNLFTAITLWSGLVCSAQAASFDCTKALTPAEKMICADAELSKLDEELNAAYSNVLKEDGSATSMRITQKRWLKKRNTCLDAACLITSYKQRTALLKASGLAPFKFTQNETLPEQATTPVCKDFKNYLNHPRSNELFKPDGTLVRESELFKSVVWETLDKEKYRSGFVANVEASNPKSEPTWRVALQLFGYYASPEWALQRALAYPFEYYPKPDQRQRWIFRLVQLRPYTRIMADPKSKVELPTWFNFNDEAYLAYEDGSVLENNKHDLVRKPFRQWVTYAGHTYSVNNSTYSGEVGAIPYYLGVEIDELRMDEAQSFMHFTCSFRAKNSQ